MSESPLETAPAEVLRRHPEPVAAVIERAEARGHHAFAEAARQAREDARSGGGGKRAR